jgi:NPCBM/NEW2 domain
VISVIFLLSVLWLGFVLDEEFSLTRGDFLVRLSAAIILGSFWGAWIVFLLGWVAGFTLSTVLVATGLVLLFNAVAWRYRRRNFAWFASLWTFDCRFWQAAAFSTTIITFYFSVCVWMNREGDILFRGNTRDLAFHMGTVSAFLEQSAFPPLNPQSAAAKLSYHFMTDFFSAILCRGGFSLFYSLKLPMVLFAFSLGALTNHFLDSVLKTRPAVIIAGLLFFFGHVGFVNLLFGLGGYPAGEVPLTLKSWSSVENQLVFPYFNFLNVIIDCFQPQLPFLFGFPCAMLVLATLYRRYREQTPTDRTTYFLVGLIAFLPLFHMHTFLTIGPLVGLVVLVEQSPRWSPGNSLDGFAAQLVRWTVDRRPLPAGLDATANAGPPTAALPSPHASLKVMALFLAVIPIGLQLGFVFSQPKAAGFSGFDVAQQLGPLPEIPNFLGLQRAWFWVRAAGVPLILGLVGALLSPWLRLHGVTASRREKIALFILLLATGAFFVLINFYRFTPNWGDSNKFFMYLDLVLCVYAGWLLAYCWEKSIGLRIMAALLVGLGSVVPTAIEWGERLGREPEQLFSGSARLVADWIKLNTPKDSVFLTANSTVHLVPALAGRRVINGAYTRETGFANETIEDLVARAYREVDPSVISQSRVDYVLVGPEEEAVYHINRAKLGRRLGLVYDQTSRGVRYTIYEIHNGSPDNESQITPTKGGRPFVWLSELEPASVQQYGTLRFDKSFDLSPLILQGQSYPNGLGTHAPSEIRFDLRGEYESFESDVGLDDSQLGGIGTIVFEVWVDEKKVYESKVMRAGDAPDTVKIDVSGALRLRLVVTDAGDGNHCDHGDWAGARLIRKK